MSLSEALKNTDTLLLDGAMGTQLDKHDLSVVAAGAIPEHIRAVAETLNAE